MKVAPPTDSMSPRISAEGAGSHDIHAKELFHAIKLDEACSKPNPDRIVI